ncbi:DGQHR domain-containing protein [Singulisphaera sp. Ch08]|uniref:DGQHR domain-containing protein n=1 Tax=Singulisphaera sp. Ch08 TaxID=3120278 RepID=A0AAU7C8T4_9BACT
MPRAFLVLDGQHRLWGYQKCSQRHRVPVAIYEGLSRAEEARLFIDINTNQRGVPAALLLDIKHLAEIESSREQILREMFDRLQRDAKSPLAGKLSATKSLSGKISRVTFNKALSTAIGSGILFEADEPTRYKLVLNYLNAFEAELPDKRLLQKSAFFEAIFETIDEVVRSTMALHGNAKKESIQRVIRPLASLDFGKGAIGKTLPSKKAIVALMQTALRKNLPISEELL